MTKLPKRSKRFGVGKEIGGAVYVHRQYEGVLPEEVTEAKRALPDDFDYDVVKFDLQSKATSFIRSADFDTAHEPTVGQSIRVAHDKSIKRTDPSSDPFIYHHKWLFVSDDYTGFKVQASIRRSQQWLALDDIDTRRIGRRSYWEQHVIPRLAKSEERWLRSAEVCKMLRISTCELSHRRNAGEIPFKKKGNTYFYQLE